jgi:hypothetical protein
VLSLALTFAGNAEDFDAVAEANFRTSLAELLGVNVTSVLLQVRSGSIVIDVRVFMSQPLASSLLTAASLSGASSPPAQRLPRPASLERSIVPHGHGKSLGSIVRHGSPF